MKKYAAAAAVAVVALALAGCTSQSFAATPAPSGTDDWRSTYVTNPDAAMLLNAIQKGWIGDDLPDAEWFSTASLLVCKQIIGGIEPRVTDNPDNNDLVVSLVEQRVCEVTR